MDTSPDRLVAGLVGDRYEITGLIASGGMGSVYRARDTVLDRTVALKVLRTGGDDPEFVARFKAEATNAARLSHPGIVQVYDFGYADGSPYMAMEFVDGQTLRDVLADKGRLRPEVATRIAVQVATALDHARRNGLVHRDIKPENILLTTDGQVKVADFGLSRAMAASRQTQAGMLFGTAHYIAPEQVEGGEIDHRTDIYALGIVIYEMLTGVTPFSGDSSVVIAYKRVAEDVPSILAIDPELPRALDAVVGHATARDPARRYPTAAAMATALRDAIPRVDTSDLGGLVHHTTAIPISRQETVAIGHGSEQPRTRTRARSRRRRWIGMIALAAILAAVAITNGPLAKTTVPSVVGSTQSDARRILTARGFTVDPVLVNDAAIPQGDVISQDPIAGTALRRGDTVTLTVSLGPSLVAMPTVTGKTFRAAAQLLSDKGLEAVRLDVFSDTVGLNRVVAQEPSPGILTEQGSRVTLQVSKGPEQITVPNLVGDPEESARTDLEDLGFKVEVKRENSTTVAEGLVISQDPEPDTAVDKGIKVTLVVSKGPPLVKVPDVICMTRRQAEDTLRAKGFAVSIQGKARGKDVVVDQDPADGEKAPEGSTVTLIMGFGAGCR